LKDLKHNRKEKLKVAVSSSELSQDLLLIKKKRMRTGFASMSTAGNYNFKISLREE
jgi:hypothetical protein